MHGSDRVKEKHENKTLAQAKKGGRFYRNAHKILAKLVLRLFRVRVHYAEREPEEGNYLLCSNHTAAMDPVVIAAALKKQQPHFMAKKELFRIPLLAGLIRILGAFPVDRTGDIGALRTTTELLEQGLCVGMFPQGTRCPGVHPSSTVENLKHGAGMLCVRTGVQVLPVCIRAKKNKLRLFGGADLIIGEPIPFEAFAAGEPCRAEYERVTHVIFDHICALYDAPLPQKEAAGKGNV